MHFLKRILLDERGVSTPEWLVLAALAALLTVAVTGDLLPVVRNAHNTVVNRTTNLAGSGY